MRFLGQVLVAAVICFLADLLGNLTHPVVHDIVLFVGGSLFGWYVTVDMLVRNGFVTWEELRKMK